MKRSLQLFFTAAFLFLSLGPQAHAGEIPDRLLEEANALHGMDLPINGRQFRVDGGGWFVNTCDSWDVVGNRGIVRIEGKYGYVDPTGHLVIRPHFNIAGNFSEGLAPVVVQADPPYLAAIDETGRVVFRLGSAFPMQPFSEGLMAAAVTQKMSSYYGTSSMSVGFMDKKGQWAITPQFPSTRSFHDGLAAAQHDRVWGYINQKGEWTIPAKFQIAYTFSEGVAAVQSVENFHWGFVDGKGEWVVPADYDSVHSFSDSLAVVEKKSPSYERLCGYIDQTGKPVIPLSYQNCEDFVDGLAPVQKGNQWGYLNKAGLMIVPPRFFKAKEFSEGLAAVKTKKNAPWGYIDRTGKMVIAPQFDKAKYFSEGVAAVSTEKHFGFINKAGRYVWQGQMCGTYARMSDD